MKQNNKIQFLKLTIFFLISLVIVQWIFPPKPPAKSEEATETKSMPKIITRTPVSFGNEALKGEFDTNNARLDNVSFKEIYSTVEKSETAVLLDEKTFAEWGFLGEATNKHSMHKAWRKISDNGGIIVLQQRAENLIYELKFSLDNTYLINVEQKVRNTGRYAEKIWAYGRMVYRGETPSSAYIHKGWIGYLNGDFVEPSISDLEDDPEKISDAMGWFGWTNHYTQAVMRTDAVNPIVKFSAGENRSQGDFQTKPMIISPGETKVVRTTLYAGPKKEAVLNAYEEKGFKHLSQSIDYGWFFMISKPMGQALNWLGNWIGNMGWAIILLTLLIKIILYPLSKKSLLSMAKMKDLQPKIKALQAKYASDKMRLQQEMIKLYKTHKVSPASGCIPMLLQIPIFFGLYRVLMVSFDLRQASFLYIPDLSQADPTSIFNLFGLLPYDIPGWLPAVGLLPILMGLAMWVQQKMQGSASTAQQNKIMTYLPIIFVLMFGGLPAGLVLYWMMSNVFSLFQTYLIQKSLN